MQKTNGDRLKWLKHRVQHLENRILRENREKELIAYLEEARKRKGTVVSDAEWEVLLPNERSELLIQYYHSLRTELLEMTRCAEEPDTIARVSRWLESPWAKIIVLTGSLAEVAALILQAIQAGGSFLSAPDQGSTDLSTWGSRAKR